MRQGQLSLLVILSIAMPFVHAEEGITVPVTEQTTEVMQPPPDSSLQQEKANADIAIVNAERAQLAHLRKENHRLRMQLQQGQSTVQPPVLNDQQQWFAVGGGVGVLGFLLGVLTTRGRRRRQWLN